MKKIVLNISVALLAVLFASSCSTMNTADNNDYFGYSNSPKAEKQTQSDNIQYSDAVVEDDYYDYNAGGAVSADPVAIKRSFVYYDYYNPYRARPFVPWSNYYYDPYMDTYVGVNVYYGSRYSRYYWRDWDYYYNHSYPYYYHNYRHHDWVYYNRYYNRSWNNHPVYVDPQRNKTTRGFGPSRGTYGNYDDVQLRSTRSSSRERSAIRGSSGESQTIRSGSSNQRSPVRSTSTRSSREENSSARSYTPSENTTRPSTTNTRSSTRTESTRSTRSSRSSSSTRSSSRSSSRSSYSTPSSSSKSSGRSSSRSSGSSSSSSRSKRR